jgi:hypothetical protein
VQLVRFAFVDPRAAFQGAASFALGDVEIVTWSEPTEGSLLVSAAVRLDDRPPVENGEVLIPEEARRRAERALEATTRILTIANGSACGLRSPGLAVAFRAEGNSDRRWFAKQNELSGFYQAIAEPDFPLGVDLNVATRLGDRPDGVELLAEGVASGRMLGRFIETVRVFERAFTEDGDRLVPLLAEFLAQRPLLRYTKSEVKNWLGRRGGNRLRDRVVHAASLKSAPALEADVRPFIARMRLAAYEVVLNKKKWASRSTERRDLWTPLAGPVDPQGRTTSSPSTRRSRWKPPSGIALRRIDCNWPSGH